MPVFQVTDPQSGRTLRLTGDSPPTEQELEQIFAAQGGQDVSGIPVDSVRTAPQQPIEEPGVIGQVGQRLQESLEPAAAILSSVIAEPIAGLAGIIQSVSPFAEEGAGARAVEATREALTFQPRTRAGREALQTVGEAIQPVGEAFESAEQFLGNEVFEATDSPALAAAATAIPTAIVEAVGIAGAKGALKAGKVTKEAAKVRQVRQAVVDAAPDIEQLKDTARSVYKELDNSGVTLRPKATRGLVNRVTEAVNKAGFDKDLNPKTAAVLNRLQAESGKPLTLTDIDTLRKVAQGAASAIEPSDARLGAIIIDNIDSFLDVVSPTAFEKGAIKASEITPKFQTARNLWGRAKRSELINDAFEKARNQASGFENGLVVQFRQILNNKKKSRFFKPDELDAMRDVVRGTTGSNIAKVIGRLGFSEGHATNIIGGSLGVAGGAAVGGPAGAVAVPIIGQVSRKLAQKLTRGKAELTDAIVRAGDDANEIAKAYISKVPKAKRSSAELSELLLRPDIALDELLDARSSLTREAAEIAKGQRILRAIAATAAVGLPGAVKQISEEQQ